MDYLAVISEEACRISEIARHRPLDARVRHIPRWTMEHLLAHSEACIGGRRTSSPPATTTERATVGHGRGQGVAPLVRGGSGEARRQALPSRRGREGRELLAGQADDGRFWHRRQAHKTTMHRWDVEAAVGGHQPIDAYFAIDGIDELFHVFTPTRGKEVLDRPIRVSTTDTQASWVLAPTEKPGPVDVVTDPIEAAVTISRPTEQVPLAIWKRRTLDEAQVEIGGLEESARKFVAGPITA